MLQEWFVLQPLSWSRNPQQGGGDVQHGCTASASCACPLSLKKTIYPPRDRHCCFKDNQNRILNTQPCNYRNSALVREHPGLWPTVPPAFFPLLSPKLQKTPGIHKRFT